MSAGLQKRSCTLAFCGISLQAEIFADIEVSPRPIPCHSLGRSSQRKRYGPYYQWTRKLQGRTVNINLSEAQVKLFQKVLDEQRKVDQLLEEMQVLSQQLLQATTLGVAPRKSRK